MASTRFVLGSPGAVLVGTSVTTTGRWTTSGGTLTTEQYVGGREAYMGGPSFAFTRGDTLTSHMDVTRGYPTRLVYVRR